MSRRNFPSPQRLTVTVKAVVALAAGALLGCTEPEGAAHPEAARPLSDGRDAIPLSDAERSLVLAEMRLMLESTEGVVAGLASNDMRAVEQAAARSGLGASGTVDQAMHASLPEAFVHMGAAAHGGFDDIALLAREGAGVDAVTMRLSQTLSQCTSCHAAFRVERHD